MLPGNLTQYRCPNREQTVQTENDWALMRMGGNGSNLNTKRPVATKCYLENM